MMSSSATVIGGLAVTYLPEGLGDPSDFEFEWGGVRFVQRVWESRVDGGAWRVDLQVQAMRGDRLTDLAAFRDYLVEYHERGDDWKPEPFGPDGLAAERDAARLLGPGLAVEVRDPFGRQGPDAVRTVAASVAEAP